MGQEHITRTLQNAIATNRLAHAFLFSGPRGVGKTTTARILAKALNCKEGPTTKPCGRCSSCIETAAGASVDVIEIDGASNRGIEHIRELREAVQYAPVGGRYKVYVIDEVHMLTNEAFNALLKTLEEPPPHVIFIFATTEPQKVPATIHSRCQRYGFKRISLQDLARKLSEITKAEGITITEAGLGMIARAAEGSLRDGQSLLDQAVSYSGMSVKDEDLRVILGAVPIETLLSFTDRLLAGDAAGLLRQVDELTEHGQNLRQFLSSLAEHLRNLIAAKIAPDPAGIIDLPSADIQALSRQAGQAEVERLLMLFDSISRTLDEMRWSPNQRFTFEIGLVKACSLKPLRPVSDLLKEVKALEARIMSIAAGRGMDVLREAPAPYTPRPVNTAHKAASAGQDELLSRIRAALRSKKPLLYSALEQAVLTESGGEELVISVAGPSFTREVVEKGEHLELIAEIASEILGRKVLVRIQPAKADKAGAASRAARSRKRATDDPAVQDALRIFGGEVIEPGTE